MITLETINKELQATRKELREVKSLLTQVNQVWLSEKDAATLLGVKSETLKKKRLSGQIDPAHFKCRSTGRGFFYLKSELDKLFTTSK